MSYWVARITGQQAASQSVLFPIQQANTWPQFILIILRVYETHGYGNEALNRGAPDIIGIRSDKQLQINNYRQGGNTV